MNGAAKDSWSKGHRPRLSAEQLAQLAEVVETGPERAVHEFVRWRRVDLQQIVAERFGVAYHERTIGKILKQLGFSHVSARPRHPAKDEETVAAFKNVWPAPSQQLLRVIRPVCANVSGLGVVPRPRWSSAHPGPHKTYGVSAIF